MQTDRCAGTRPWLLGLLLAMSVASSSVSAAELYGAVGAIEVVGQTADPGSIILIDPATANSTFLGDPVATPDVGVVGLDFDSTGRLFGVTRRSGQPTGLIEIDPKTGLLVQSVGTITHEGVPISINDLAFQPGTDVLFGTATGGGGELCPSCLFTIDTVTADATLIGDPSLSNPAFNKSGGLAFDAAGTLYATTTFINPILAILNPSNGTVVATEPVVVAPPANLEFGGFFDGLAIRPFDGVLYATHGVASSEIFRRHPQTHQWILIGPTGQATSDLAFLPCNVPGEIADLTVAGGAAGTLAWSPEALSCTYDVLRGTIGEWPVGTGPSETILVSGTATTGASDPAVPVMGEGFYYLVRGRNACGTAGPWNGL